MSQPQGYPHYQDSPAHQAASRKMKRKHQGGGSQQQQQRQHPSHLRGGPGGGSSGAARQAFLVPPGSTGPMAWGHAYEDEGTDMIMDEMDRLTPRDLAVARFRRNHDFIEAIFDEKKIANLQPAPSPYADLSKKDLQAQLDQSEVQTAEMKRLHEERLQSFKQNISPEQIERDVARQAEVNADEEAALEPWARGAGKGRRLTAGFAYVQARTPEVVKGALRAREAALVEQRAEMSGSQESVEARQQKAAEDEGIRKLNLEHGMEPPVAANVPPPPQMPQQPQQQPRPQPQQQQSLPPQQPQQPQSGTQEAQQQQASAAASQPAQTAEVEPANVGGEAADAAADEDADADADAEADADADADGDGDGDQEMIELVDNGGGGAAGLAAEPEAAQGEQAQQTPQETTDAATANEGTLTHPLSAEAAAAASAPEGTTEAPLAEHPQDAPEAATEATPEALSGDAPMPILEDAPEAPSETAVPAEPEAEAEAAPAAPSEAAPITAATAEVVPAPSGPSPGVPPVAQEVAQQHPAEELMKAPTPSLDENLAENDAPKQL